MTHQATETRTLRDEGDARSGTAPDVMVRAVGAMLALAVAAVHVADQGGVTALTSPAWIGWGYRTIEVGAVLTALVLLLPSSARLPAWAGWAAGALLGVGPFLAYILSRTVGLPGDPGDVGNWGYWVGTVSMFVEVALVLLSVSMLLSLRPLAVRVPLRQLAVRGSLQDLIPRARGGE